jgi:hypothetical protein
MSYLRCGSNARKRHPRQTIWILKSWVRVIQKSVRMLSDLLDRTILNADSSEMSPLQNCFLSCLGQSVLYLSLNCQQQYLILRPC